LCQITICYCH